LEVWTYGSNWKLMKRKFASLIWSKYWNIGLEEALNLFLLPKDL
jgi:topoisomerase IA-like protein